MRQPVSRHAVWSCVCAFAAGAVLCGPPSLAQELEYGVDVGIGWSDNIRRTPSDQVDETIPTVGVDLRWQREGRFSADVLVDASYLDYLDDTYDSEIVGGLDADLRFGIVPGRFDWVLVDTYGQMDLDPFQASTPGSREDVNYLTTGPDFTVRLGSATRFLLFGRYSNTAYEETNLDNDRLSGGVSLIRETSSQSALSLNAVVDRVEFDDSAANPDYDRQSIFLGYEIEGARTRLSASAGYTALKLSGETRDSPLFDVQLERDLNSNSTLSFSGGIRSSDASESLRNGDPAGGGESRPGEVATSDPFEMRYIGVGWSKSGRRTTLSLNAGWEEDVYETDSDLDRKRTFLEASVQRRLTRALRLRLIGSLYKNDYGTVGYDDTEWRAGLGLSWNLTGRLYVELDADHYDRSSSDPLTEYDENRFFVRLAWRNIAGQ